MHKSFGEKLKDFFILVGKKYRILLPFAVVGLFVVMLMTNIFRYISTSGKRIFCLIFVLCLFFMGNSFAFPIFNYANMFVSNNDISDEIMADNSELILSEINQVDIAEDTTAIHEYGELDENDTVSVEEIIDNYKESENSTEPSYENLESENIFSREDWRLILINKQHPIPDDYSFTLGNLSASMQCDERIIDDLFLMLKDAKDQGVSLVICSPYRDLAKQESLFSRKMNKYMSNGYSYMDAYKIASQAVTVPGASEHQVGLAIDIVTKDYAVLDEGFENTEAGIWLRDHSAEYGFVIRYPKNKEYITSIEYEPWHFRYVGREAALIMNKDDICLEEFWDKYL